MRRASRSRAPCAALAIVFAGAATARGATLDLPSGEGAPPAASRVLLLSVDDATGILGTDLVITWDPAVAQASLVTRGAVASTQTLAYNLSPSGTLRVSLYGTGPLAGGGALLEITFGAIGPPGAFTHLDIAAADLNEGAIPAILLDGGFCVQAPPPAVPGLHGGMPAGAPVATFSWQPVPWATGYNFYRGTSPDLSDLACLAPGVTGTQVTDEGLVPAPGQLFVHLVTATACSGESDLDFSSSGEPRPLPPPCP